jgi:amidase
VIEITPPEISYKGFRTLLNIDMKYGLPRYLKNNADPSLFIKNVKDVIAFNRKDSLLRAPYGQQLFEGILKDSTKPKEFKILKMKLLTNVLDFFKIMAYENLDVILSINNFHSGVAAVAEHPTLTVPMGYKKSGEPISLTFIGTPFSEIKLLEIGYAFEQLTKVRKMPKNYQ